MFGQFEKSQPVANAFKFYCMYFFASSLPIKLALPQAAQLSILYLQRSVVFHFHGDLNKGCTTDSIEQRRKKPSTWRDLNPRPQEFCSAGMCFTPA